MEWTETTNRSAKNRLLKSFFELNFGVKLGILNKNGSEGGKKQICKEFESKIVNFEQKNW